MEKRKAAYWQVDNVFYEERAIRQAVRAQREDSGAAHAIGGGHSISDPTGSAAVRRATPLQSVTLATGRVIHKPESWLYVCDVCYGRMSEQEARILRLYYSRRMSPVEIVVKIGGYSKRAIYYLVHRFCSYGVELAYQLGLVKVWED